MNRNIEAVCGKAQSKTQEGIKGMSVGDIEKLISEAVASNSNLSSEFERMRKGKPGKGVSRRIMYCKFIKSKLASKWAEITGKRNSPKSPPKSPPKSANKSPIIKQFNAENFPFVFETEEGPSEPVNENEPRQAENIYNGNFERPNYGPYVKESRRKEPDPLAGKPSRRTMIKINTAIKRAKERGENLPEFKTTRNKLLWFQTFKPKNGPRKSTKKPVIKRNQPKPPPPIMAPPALMKFTGPNARVPTQSKIVLATGTRLSNAEMKEATKFAENITDILVKINKTNVNGMRKVLLRRYAAGNANATLKKLQKLQTFNYASIRNVMRQMEFERAKILKNLGDPIVPPAPEKENKPAFSMIPYGPDIREIARKAKAKKVANRTAAELAAIRFVEDLNKVAAKSRAPKPAVKVFVTERGPNVEETSNRENMGGVEVKSIGSSAGSSAGSPKRVSPKGKKAITQTEAKRIIEAAAAEKALKLSVPLMVRNLKMGKFKLENLNKNSLVKIAKRVYEVARPGDVIPFEKANEARLQKLIQLAIKKL